MKKFVTNSIAAALMSVAFAPAAFADPDSSGWVNIESDWYTDDSKRCLNASQHGIVCQVFRKGQNFNHQKFAAGTDREKILQQFVNQDFIQNGILKVNVLAQI